MLYGYTNAFLMSVFHVRFQSSLSFDIKNAHPKRIHTVKRESTKNASEIDKVFCCLFRLFRYCDGNGVGGEGSADGENQFGEIRWGQLAPALVVYR
jgi:hypothetical protein